jgi:hypothetical protein
MLEHLSNKPERVIHVALLNDGTECWRPVDAVQIDEDVYRILTPSIEDEEWLFNTGDVVRCRARLSFDGKPFLEAYELAPQD